MNTANAYIRNKKRYKKLFQIGSGRVVGDTTITKYCCNAITQYP